MDELTEGRHWAVIFLASVDLVCVFEAGDSIREGHVKAGVVWLMVAIGFSVIGFNWSKLKKRFSKGGHQLQLSRPEPSQMPVAEPQTGTPLQDDKPPTLLDLFNRDFNTALTVTDQDSHAWEVHAPDGAKVEVRRRVYMDFPAKTKFVSFYVAKPVPPPLDFKGEKTFAACLQLLEINAVQQSFEHFAKNVGVMGGRDGQMTTFQDLTFSGRVMIYHEEFLSIPQKAQIIEAYKKQNLDVQFMGDQYLGSQVTAWHQRNDLKKYEMKVRTDMEADFKR